jgi:hypothetical protein
MQTRHRCFLTAVALTVAFALPNGAGSHAHVHGAAAAFAYRQPAPGQLGRADLRRLATRRWRAYRLSSGGPTVRVSTEYADPTAIAQRWTAFFYSLIHGPELRVLDAYIAPLADVKDMCRSSEALGCYGDDHLVISDQGADGISAASVATHEYGHHVAFNRVNAPWPAIDWGPKRWATYQRVCSRSSVGTAYPGAEDANYALNPGEAWAETYRVLNETVVGLPETWPIIDSSFAPDPGALAAAREDVVDPWTAPSATTTRIRFGRNARTRTVQVATPLDGVLHADVQPGSDDITLLSSDSGRTLARGVWTRAGAKGVDYTVCGQRALALRIARHSRAFTLRLSVP